MSNPHYIKADYLIDGSGEPIRKNVLLTITNGTISNIDRYDNDNAPAPAATTDLSQCTILPPLIDSHVHLCMSGSTDEQLREQQLTASCEELRSRIAEHIHYHFSHGVLAVRDGGDRQGCTLRYNSEISGKAQDPVIIKTAGRAWHRQGRYGGFIGRVPEDGESLATAFAKNEDLADHVKLINSGLNSLSNFGGQTLPQFNFEDIKELVQLAEKQGKKVMAHANGSLPVRMAIDAGCHSIEHGFFMGKENLKRMADAQITWVPTAVTMKAFTETVAAGDSKSRRKVAEQTLNHQLEQMALARQYGVTIALGTDAGSQGVLHGESVAEEFKLILKAGYCLPEAVRCATYNGARLLGLEEIGRIAKGRPANFIVARATPAMLPRKLSYLEAIYLNGRPCDTKYFHKF